MFFKEFTYGQFRYTVYIESVETFLLPQISAGSNYGGRELMCHGIYYSFWHTVWIPKDTEIRSEDICDLTMEPIWIGVLQRMLMETYSRGMGAAIDTRK